MSLFDANYEGRVNTCGNIIFQQQQPHYPGAIRNKSFCIFCDAEISGCSRCSCYPVVPPLHLLRTTRPGLSSTLRSRRSLRSLARCAATKHFTNIFVRFAPLGASWEHLKAFGGVFGRLEVVLDTSWAILEQTWRVLGCLSHLLPM